MLERIGYDPGMDRWGAAADATVGRVALLSEGIASVLTDAGPCRAGFGGGLLARMAADAAAAPCVGDWCVLRTWPRNRVTLDRLLPRSTVLLGRSSSGVGGPVLCANADLVAVVVVAAGPHPEAAALDRTLDRIREGGARPLVVVAGPDPAVDPEPLARELGEHLGGKVDVTTVRAGTGHGVPALRERLQGRLTMALTGGSDHARSALVGALLGGEALATRDTGGLVPLPSGGAVIDTHGLPCDPPPSRPPTWSGQECREAQEATDHPSGAAGRRGGGAPGRRRRVRR